MLSSAPRSLLFQIEIFVKRWSDCHVVKFCDIVFSFRFLSINWYFENQFFHVPKYFCAMLTFPNSYLFQAPRNNTPVMTFLHFRASLQWGKAEWRYWIPVLNLTHTPVNPTPLTHQPFFREWCSSLGVSERIEYSRRDQNLGHCTESQLNLTFYHISRLMTNQQNYCTPSEDSDQPGHPPNLIGVSAVCSMGSWRPNVSSCGQRRLGWSEFSLGAHSFCWFCHEAAHISDANIIFRIY